MRINVVKPDSVLSTSRGFTIFLAGSIEMGAAENGDLIFLDAEVVELRHKAVVVAVRAEGEKRAKSGRTLLATARFVFVTKKNGEYHYHGLQLPTA